MRLESEFRRYHLSKNDKYKEKWTRRVIFIKTSLSTVAVARSSPDLFVQCASGASNFATSAFLQLLVDWTFLRNWEILKIIMERNQPFLHNFLPWTQRLSKRRR